MRCCVSKYAIDVFFVLKESLTYYTGSYLQDEGDNNCTDSCTASVFHLLYCGLPFLFLLTSPLH